MRQTYEANGRNELDEYTEKEWWQVEKTNQTEAGMLKELAWRRKDFNGREDQCDDSGIISLLLTVCLGDLRLLFF